MKNSTSISQNIASAFYPCLNSVNTVLGRELLQHGRHRLRVHRRNGQPLQAALHRGCFPQTAGAQRFTQDPLSRSAAHLRESDAQKRPLAQGSTGLFRPLDCERNFEYLHAFGLEQQGKCGKSHGRCGETARKHHIREPVGEVKSLIR